ncbi:MAG: TIGR03663 family protein, partial [Dehalococcoidia bacterium]|nr:TIGR03663 family protein [Dehalococcoidia bacterium]
MKLESKEEARPSLLDRLLGVEPIPVRWEIAAYIALVALAAALRFWDLGSRAIHHDESLHATYSWYLATGKGYRHDPMMHGPFQFHATAIVYFLLGISDYTSRVMPAIFGTALVALPWFWRRQLGRAGALVSTGMLTISPIFLYYSRFARNDIYMAVWTLLTAIFIWRYLEERRPRDLYFL